MVTSAYVANAVPVSEYTLSTILLSLKHFWRSAAQTRLHGGWGDHTRWVPGGFRSTVGMISCGIIARKTLEMLRMFDLHRLIYCPFLSAKEAVELGVERCTLSELFRRSDVVSLHTPDLPETRGLITGEHFRSMKQGATFINAARGAVVPCRNHPPDGRDRHRYRRARRLARYVSNRRYSHRVNPPIFRLSRAWTPSRHSGLSGKSPAAGRKRRAWPMWTGGSPGLREIAAEWTAHFPRLFTVAETSRLRGVARPGRGLRQRPGHAA